MLIRWVHWFATALVCVSLGERQLVGAGESDAASAQRSSSVDQSLPTMRLRLKNNSVAIGQISATPTPNAVAWLNEGFSEPFLIELNAIRSLSRSQAIAPLGEACQNCFQVETTDGEMVVGSIVALDENECSIENSHLGTIAIPRNRIASFTRVGQLGDIVYAGLLDEKVWQPVSSHKDWQFRGGSLQALRQGASIVGDVRLPSQSEINLSLRWKGVPDFTIFLGTLISQRNKGALPAAARIEIWNRNVVLVRETDRDADLTLLMVVSDQNPQIELNILLDQEKGRAHVRDLHGQRLGSVSMPMDNPQTRPAIHISNHGPGLFVEQLEVRQWDGISLLSSEKVDHINLRDGNSIPGRIVGISPDLSHFLLGDLNQGPSQISVDQVAFARLNATPTAAFQQAQPRSTSSLEVILTDHTRLKCQWLPGMGDKIRFSSLSIGREFEMEPQQLAGLVGNEQSYSFSSSRSPSGTLLLGQSELAGCLTQSEKSATSDASASPTALRWKPHGSLTSGTWTKESEGQIVYSQRLFPEHWPQPRLGEPTGRVTSAFASGLTAAEQPTQTGLEAPQTNSQEEGVDHAQPTRQIHFLSGDTIDGYVDRIDSQGVHFRSNQTQVGFVEHAKMNNLWLNSLTSSSKQPPEEKLQRLMIVPRNMKDDPPTHLLLSVSGDWLRCRLLELNQDFASAEVRREVLTIPRDQICQIVWLHHRQWPAQTDHQSASQADQVSANEEEPPSASKVDDGRIHLVQNDRGITLVPERLDDDEIYGSSQLLGACSVNLRSVSRILFGPRLDQRIVESKTNPWVLTLAPTPRSSIPQLEKQQRLQQSPLVGQPAPSFILTCLNGQKVQMSNLLGKIMVLDFWASWCDPCAKSLPVVEEIVSKFEPMKVGLLAINVQEAEPRVHSAAQQWGLSAPVALDKDGSIAERYLATALPQTVVIDARGIIRYVFAGEGLATTQELELAIETLLKGE